MLQIDNNSNKFVWYIIILISLFIIILFAKDQLMQIQVNNDEKVINEFKFQEKRNEITRLDEIKKKLNTSEVNIEKYLISEDGEWIKENEIIDYIYSKIEDDNLKYTDGIAVIKNISITEWSVNEMWFMESNVTLNLKVPSEDRMFKILNFFSSKDSKYQFFIDTFTYPNVETESSFNITLPLKIFYK